MAAAVSTAAPVGAAGSMRVELHRLRVCESGDNYSLDTGNGFYGAYQFSERTWRGLGFHGRPDNARHGTQDAAARELHTRDGWSAWPSCSHREHLR